MVNKFELQIAIGMRVKAIRESKDIKQQDLAAYCNFEKSNLARLEAGKTNPTIYTLKVIADNLNVKLEQLISGI